MMFLWIITATAACLCSAAEYDLKGDANIYTSILWDLERLEAQRSDVHPVLQRASSVCYDELGCFDKNGTFKHLKQLPEPPETVNTQFLLYTKKNRLQPQLIDYKKPKTISDSNFDASKPVKFITHGFGGKNNLTWVWEMKNAFLEKYDVNVIVVDWSLGARVPYYIQAAVNSELVGAQVSVLIFLLKDKWKISEKNVHLVGFSLGAQVVGFVGKKMRELRGIRPARITGLDPASPLFEDNGGEVHLWHEDADFVDVVHTNADSLLYGGVGISIPIGHVDFYPNGGKRQPGCGSTLKGAFVDLFKGERERTCNHERAVHLFTDSILRPDSCQYVAYRCVNYTEFTGAKCLTCGSGDTACGRMGYNVDGRGTYYLLTKAKKPYCSDLAKLSVEFAKNIKKSFGLIIVNLTGANGIKENITLTEKDDKLVPGSSKTVAIALSKDMSPLSSVTALYIRYNGWFVKGAETYALGSVHIEDTNGKTMFKTCEEGNIILKDNEYRELKAC